MYRKIKRKCFKGGDKVNINMLAYGHNFEKQNLITLKDKKGTYDLYVCSNCGIKGKRRGMSNEVEIEDENSEECCKKERKIRVKALCKGKDKTFIEIFYVKSVETAEEEIQLAIKWFNDGLNRYESPRELVKIESIEEKLEDEE